MSPQSVCTAPLSRAACLRQSPPCALAAGRVAFPPSNDHVATNLNKKQRVSQVPTAPLLFFRFVLVVCCFPPLPPPSGLKPPACDSSPRGGPLRPLAAAGSLLPSVGRSGGAFRPPVAHKPLLAAMGILGRVLSAARVSQAATPPLPHSKQLHTFCVILLTQNQKSRCSSRRLSSPKITQNIYYFA